MGCMMPSSRIEAASSLSDSSSKSCRGCPGLGLMRGEFYFVYRRRASCLYVVYGDEGVEAAAECVAFIDGHVLGGYSLRQCREEFYFDFFSRLMSSLASCRWLRAPLELGSYMSTGMPWLGASLSFMLRCITVSKTSSRKCFFSSS